MAVYAYCRVSTTAQASEGESLAVQQRQVEGWCHMQGHELTAVIVEEAVSGSVPLADRPRGAELMARLQPGDTIVAAKLDRLFRSALDALQMVERLKTEGVSLVLLDLGGDISGNGMSKLFLTIAAAFAEAERDRIRERITQVKRDQAARGRFLGGSKPFGYDLGEGGELVENAAEQAAIQQMIQLRQTGKSLRAVAEAVSASLGRSISHVCVRGVLARA